MKNLTLSRWMSLALLVLLCTSFSPVKYGIYAQLLPGSNKKFVIQIVPDKTYANVVAYVNFYASNNKRIAQEAYALCDDKDKYIRKDQCTNRVFKFSFDETVARITIDHVVEGAVLEEDGSGKKGNTLAMPISKSALGPLEK